MGQTPGAANGQVIKIITTSVASSARLVLALRFAVPAQTGEEFSLGKLN